jgi:ubiquinone/menaquinone biosynthesis C-methylase UbiE
MAKNNEKQRENFSRQMVDILNHGALNLALAIGYRTGLFEVMDGFDTPSSLETIADRSGLNPRYITEWLGIMATGGIVELSRGTGRENLYLLPKAHGDLLCRRAGHANLGVYTQEIPLLTLCALETVVQRFTSGDGITYDHYPRFQSFMSELADAKHRRVLVNELLPSVDNGKLVRRLEDGIRVCDLGCAEGVALRLMAKAFPRSRFTGIDVSEEVIRSADSEARKEGLQNTEFLALDAATLKDRGELGGRFDYITAFDAIHDQTHPLEALKGVRHCLADGGLFSMVDIAASTDLDHNLAHPMGPFLYTVSLMHCMPVGLVRGGTGLGMMWGRQKAVEMLREAGFTDIEVSAIPNDSFNDHFLCRMPAACR